MGILPYVSRSCGSSCFATGLPISELGGDWPPCLPRRKLTSDMWATDISFYFASDLFPFCLRGLG